MKAALVCDLEPFERSPNSLAQPLSFGLQTPRPVPLIPHPVRSTTAPPIAALKKFHVLELWFC